jgi:hypothetical protein
METTRRRFLGGLAVASAASADPLVAAAPKMTAQERYDYHLAELQKAAAEINPMISQWRVNHLEHDSQSRAIVIVAYQNRYEGDGLYRVADPNWSGKYQVYDVKLMSYRIDGERAFHVSTPTERMLLTERRFNEAMGRKVGGLL